MVLGADRRVIGILFERDIVRTFAEFGSDAPTKRLAQIMTREVATCGEADTAVSIMERMTANRSDTFRWLTGIGWSASCRSATSSNTAVGNGAGVRGIARLYPERLACAWRGRRRRNLVCCFGSAFISISPIPRSMFRLVIQARDPKGDITSPSATVRRYGVPAAADWGHGEPSLAARRVEDQPT